MDNILSQFDGFNQLKEKKNVYYKKNPNVPCYNENNIKPNPLHIDTYFHQLNPTVPKSMYEMYQSTFPNFFLNIMLGCGLNNVTSDWEFPQCSTFSKKHSSGLINQHDQYTSASSNLNSTHVPKRFSYNKSHHRSFISPTSNTALISSVQQIKFSDSICHETYSPYVHAEYNINKDYEANFNQSNIPMASEESSISSLNTSHIEMKNDFSHNQKSGYRTLKNGRISFYNVQPKPHSSYLTLRDLSRKDSSHLIQSAGLNQSDFQYSSASNFLFNVKTYIESLGVKKTQLTKENSDESKELTHHELEYGDLIHDKITHASLSDDQSLNESISSVHSTAATVSGHISLEKAHNCLRTKLRDEGYTESTIDYELSCRLSPLQAKRCQRRRQKHYQKRLLKLYRTKHKLYEQPKHSNVSKAIISESSSTFNLSIRNNIYSNHHIHKSDMQNRYIHSTKNSLSPQCTRVDTTDLPLCNSFNVSTPYFELYKTNYNNSFIFNPTKTLYKNSNPLNFNKSSCEITNEDKLMIRLHQRHITYQLSQLQKLRDRGELSISDFEEAKRTIFEDLFHVDTNGQIRLRRNAIYNKFKSIIPRLAEKRKSEFISYPSRNKRFRSNECMVYQYYFDENQQKIVETSVECDEMEFDDERPYLTEDIDDEDTLGTTIEIHSNDDISLDSKEYDYKICRLRWAQRVEKELMRFIRKSSLKDERERQRKQYNFERRRILMKRFDQRAPPEARMFQQDTAIKKISNQQRIQELIHWKLTLDTLPEWMRGAKIPRQIIFPDDLRKL